MAVSPVASGRRSSSATGRKAKPVTRKKRAGKKAKAARARAADDAPADAPVGSWQDWMQVPEGRSAGRYERLAYERHTRDYALTQRAAGHPKGFTFDPEAGMRVLVYIERFCQHHKGEWAGCPLLLGAWQRFCVMATYGWKKPDGTRRFSISYREVPRKNGKTEQAAAEASYLLAGDQENGAEVYCTATKEDQAKLCWDTVRHMVKQSPELARFVTIRQKAILCERTASVFKPLGADSKTLDGLNPHGHVCDEMHAHKSRGVWDVMISAQGARRQPLNIVITTAGVYDPESIGWELHLHAQQVLDGVVEDDGFFAIIFAMDVKDEHSKEAGDDWQDPATWLKANPNLGVSIREDYLAEQAKRAKATPSALNTFLRLHLNVWTAQVTRWISVDAWDACGATDLAPLESCKDRIAFMGLDLSTKLDITALAIALPYGDGCYDLHVRFWVPEELVKERARVGKSPDYLAWVRDGHLIQTPGNVIDYTFIKKEIVALNSVLRIRQVGYDPWNATQLATDLVGEGFSTDAEAPYRQLIEMRQGMRTLSEPSKLFEALIMQGKLRHTRNPVMRWMVDNAAIRIDSNNNITPDKRSALGKIDGVVAAIMALGRALVEPKKQGSVYESRGLRSF